MLLMFEPKKRKARSTSRAIKRDESRKVYANLEDKGEMRSFMAFDRVEEMYSAFYAGLDPRRKQEMADGGMVKEDRNAMANLSPTPISREYPPAAFWSSPYIDDSVEEK